MAPRPDTRRIISCPPPFCNTQFAQFSFFLPGQDRLPNG